MVLVDTKVKTEGDRGLGSLELEVIEDTDQFLGLKPKWAEALERINNDNIFLTHEWLYHWWNNFGQGKRLLILIVRDRGEVCCIAPLMCTVYSHFWLRVRKIEFISAGYANWLDFISVTRVSESVELILTYLLESHHLWDLIDLRKLREESVTLKVFEGVLESFRKNRIFWWKDIYPDFFYLPIKGSWENYLKGNKRIRKDLRQAKRRFERFETVEIESCDRPDTIKEKMDLVFKIHQESRRRDKKFPLEKENQRFFQAIAEVFAARGMLILFLLKINSLPVAFSLSFVYRGRVYGYVMGFHGKYEGLSPGIILMNRLIEYSFQQKVRELDLYRGNRGLKTRWTSLTRRQVRVRIFKKALYSTILYIVFCGIVPIRPLIKKVRSFFLL